MTPGQYDKVASIIGGYGRQLPDWEELREADQATLGALRLESASAVTVLTPHGPQPLEASTWDRLGDGRLYVSDDGRLAGQFEAGGWQGVFHGTPAGPDREADTALREAITAISEAAADGSLSYPERLEGALAVLRRYRMANE